MSKKAKGKMYPKSAAIHAYRMFSLGRINGPEHHPGQMQLPMVVPAETGPRLLPYVLYAAADPDGTVRMPLSELALLVGKTPRTVERWRERIRDLGFICKVSNGNRYAASTYLLMVPDWAVEQMVERYPDTFERDPRHDTQDVASSPAESSPSGDTQDVASSAAPEILDTTSERLEATSPRSDCRLEEEEGDSLRSSPLVEPPRRRDPSTVAPDGAGDDDECGCPIDITGCADLLADLIVGNGRKIRPTVTCTAWHRPIRLMIDRDHLSVAEIEGAIRWSQADPFWKANILSPAKLRAKYDQLRLRALADRQRQVTTQPSKWATALSLVPADDDRPAIEGTPR